MDMILDRIAEVVKSFPCLYFHVRLVFRHRHVYVPSLTDALSIFSKPKWWGSEILLCPLSIVSPLIILHILIIERGAQMRPAGTLFFTAATKACTKYFGRHLRETDIHVPVSKLERTGIIKGGRGRVTTNS